MNIALWTEGLAIMLIGVGVVFAFIVLTVISMTIMSKFVMYLNKIFPEVVPQVAGASKVKVSDDSQIALAIAMAMAKK